MAYYTKPHFPHSDLNATFQSRPISHRKSSKYFLCKSFIFLIFLVFLPLFPSQAPEFFDQSLLTKYWELFHLMFIGIVVSYGLFSRRNNVQMGVDESDSNFVDRESYLSKMFQVSSIFEDFEDLTASDEKKINKFSYSRRPHFDSMDDFSNFNSQSKIRYENSYEFADTDNGQACKSRYSHGGSVVVVAGANYSSGEPGALVHYKPLGLPVRSLRSSLTETEDVVFDRGSDSGSVSKNSSRSSENCGRSEFGDNCCVNLEEKFDESVVTSFSPFQWQEKSRKTVMRENVENAVHGSHFRTPSIDETQFESLNKSRSLHSTISQSSKTSSSSSSSTRKHRKMSSLGNISSKSFSSKSLHSRQYSVNSLSENSRGCSEDHLTEQENPYECHESIGSFPNLDRTFTSIPKVTSRGKSVRTIRADAVTTGKMKGQEMSRNQLHNDNNVGKKFEEAEPGASSYMREDGMKFGWPCTVNKSNQKPDHSNRLSKMTFSEFNKEKEDTDVLLADIEDNSESAGENIHESSDEEAASSVAGDTESGAHEVDKKAGEFIAKFREQIMLQKMASISRSRGGSFSSTSSYFT